jgi:hypothetical protein
VIQVAALIGSFSYLFAASITTESRRSCGFLRSVLHIAWIIRKHPCLHANNHSIPSAKKWQPVPHEFENPPRNVVLAHPTKKPPQNRGGFSCPALMGVLS